MHDIETKSALGLMTMLALRGVGPATALKVANAFNTFGEVFEAPPEAFKGIANEPNRKLLTENRDALLRAHEGVYEEIQNTWDIGAKVVTMFDRDYPARLHGIKDQPIVLYYSGNLSVLDNAVACVGTREPTEFGSVAAERMTGALADEGYTIVSGLARGIDSIAHRAAIEHNAPTVAVLGSGIDTYSSDSAINLVQEILEKGGLVLTEQPLGRDHDPTTLIRRNRIQTGVSLATFVMQCNIPSGTMHAVRYSLHQGRPIYAPAVPERFRHDLGNHGVTNLLRLRGPELAELLDPAPSKDLRRILEEEFADRPVARGVAGRDAYPSLFAELAALQGGPEMAHEEPAPALSC